MSPTVLLLSRELLIAMAPTIATEPYYDDHAARALVHRAVVTAQEFYARVAEAPSADDRTSKHLMSDAEVAEHDARLDAEIGTARGQS